MIESDTGYIEAKKQDRENMKTNYNRREHTRGEHRTGIHVNQGNENRNT
jgi:phage protein D